MSGRSSISAYTPSNTDPEILKRIFVQREKLLERVVDRLARSMTTGDKHHILLIGPRGSGKTHFVSLVEWELRKRQELKDKMRIAWLGEDDSFTGLVHLAFGIAKQLAQEYPDEFSSDFKDSVRGLKPDDAALSVLQMAVEQLQDRSLILMTENMDLTFRGLGDSGRKKWRAFLQETKCIATLATSQQLFDGVSNRNEVFFGFFDIKHLEPLSVDEAQELICHISLEQNKTELVKFLKTPEGRYRIRALHYLAGGNHRMYVLLSEFLTKDSLEDLVSAFEELANDMTPYFQERMRSLSDQQRQLAQCLCDTEGALTVKQIAEETFIEERSCSKQLGILKSKGYVRSEKRGKESYYDMAEPLMRLCLEVKNQRGRPLQLVARFLRAWFPLAELQGLTNSRDWHPRVDDYRLLAFQSGSAIEREVASKLKLEIAENISKGHLDTASELAKELHYADKPLALDTEAELGFLKGDLDHARAKLTAIIDMTDASTSERARAFVNRGATYREQGDVELALADYSEVVGLADAPIELRADALIKRGIAQGELGNSELELADYSAVINLPDLPAKLKGDAYALRGFTHREHGNVEQELDDYTTVIEMANISSKSKARALINRAFTCGQKGKLALALADYTRVVGMSDLPAEQKVEAFINRGGIYGGQGDLELALADFQEVIEMPDLSAVQRADALYNRGVAYGNMGKKKLAVADYTAVIEMPDALSEQKTDAVLNRGGMNWSIRNFEESTADFESALNLNSVTEELRTRVLFAVVEPMIEHRSRNEIVSALKNAFVEGDSESLDYGGTPKDLIWMVLRRSPKEWSLYIYEIANLYIDYGVGEKLGQGVTQSIQYLDEGGFSPSQIETWNQAWQSAGKDCEDLQIPLRCLQAAVAVMKSDPSTDQPLFKLPLEIRRLVRPLLAHSLGDLEPSK